MEFIQQVFDFLTQPGNGERVFGLIFIFLVVLTICSFLTYYIIDIILDFFKTLIGTFKFSRKERIVEVPKYVTPPENKEIDKYLIILKKIADDYEKDNIKL